jgi:hypothetical protein
MKRHWSEEEDEEKNVSRIRKKTFYLQFSVGTPEGNRKVYLVLKKFKKCLIKK